MTDDERNAALDWHESQMDWHKRNNRGVLIRSRLWQWNWRQFRWHSRRWWALGGFSRMAARVLKTRSKEIAENITRNNPLIELLKKK